MPPPPSRSSKRYLPSNTWPIKGSFGASATVSSACNGVKSDGHTCTSSGYRWPHFGHWSIRISGEHDHYRLQMGLSVRREDYSTTYCLLSTAIQFFPETNESLS